MMTEQIPEIQEKPIQSEVVSEIPQNKNFFKTVLLVVLGLIIMAGAVYAGYQVGRKSVPLTQIPIDYGPVEIEVIPSPDTMGGWKTYTNTLFNLSFKYPVGAVIKQEKTIKGSPQVFFIGLENPNFNLSIFKKMAEENEDYYLDIISKDGISIDSISWRIFYFPQGYCDMAGCSLPLVAYKTTKNDYLYIFSFYGTSQTNSLQNLILSTFKFLD